MKIVTPVANKVSENQPLVGKAKVAKITQDSATSERVKIAVRWGDEDDLETIFDREIDRRANGRLTRLIGSFDRTSDEGRARIEVIRGSEKNVLYEGNISYPNLMRIYGFADRFAGVSLN